MYNYNYRQTNIKKVTRELIQEIIETSLKTETSDFYVIYSRSIPSNHTDRPKNSIIIRRCCEMVELLIVDDTINFPVEYRLNIVDTAVIAREFYHAIRLVYKLKKLSATDKPKLVSFRDYMAKEYPASVDENRFAGGVCGCPYMYGCLANQDHAKPVYCGNVKDCCTKCWDRPYVEAK